MPGRRSTLKIPAADAFLQLQHLLKGIILLVHILMQWCTLLVVELAVRVYFFGVELEKGVKISMIVLLFGSLVLIVHDEAPVG